MDDNPDGAWLQEPVDVTLQEQQGQSPDQQSEGTEYKGIEPRRSKGLRQWPLMVISGVLYSKTFEWPLSVDLR